MNQYINPSLKVLRHADRIAELQANRIPYPVNVEVDISNRCLLGCEWCHFGYTHSRGPLAKSTNKEGLEDMGDLMSPTLFERFAPEMSACGVQSVTFSGGGDPLTHPDFGSFLRAAKSANLKVGLYTSLRGAKEIDLSLISIYCEWVVVSIDEPDAESYQRVKGVDAFGQITESVKRLMLEKNTKYKGTTDCIVGASFLINKDNVYKIHKMVKLHEELKTDYALFRPTIQYDLKNPSVMVEKHSGNWMDKLAMIMIDSKYHERKDIEASAKKFLRYRDWDNTDRGYSECVANLFTGCITPNGKVWVCINRRGFPGSCVGDLNLESFREVWQKQSRHTDFDQCRVCCRGDELNLVLQPLLQIQKHEEFV